MLISNILYPFFLHREFSFFVRKKCGIDIYLEFHSMISENNGKSNDSNLEKRSHAKNDFVNREM